ncbi:MAG: hypothetical protein SGJ10_05085 [Bacteroidota bacterium]|nr:hypothetical protein [Bacteroidota bacterium]
MSLLLNDSSDTMELFAFYPPAAWQYDYSNDTTVYDSCSLSINASPNPFGNNIGLTINNADSYDADIVVKIVDLQAYQVYSQLSNVSPNSSTTITPDTGNFTAGYYYAVVFKNGNACCYTLIYKE